MNYMQIMKSLFSGVTKTFSQALLVAAVSVLPAHALDLNDAQISKFIDEVVAEKKLDRSFVEKALAGTTKQDSIIKAMQRPAEKVKPWKDYRKIFITTKGIKSGKAFIEKHRATLERAEKEYGVPVEMIAAIIGIETRYGTNMGSYKVMDALSTLAFYYPKRAKFFRSELKHFLDLSKQQGFDPLTLKGSYAGAMGYGQFMPSSFLHYAVDFDGDGIKDIWNNPVDAIGSVANYFKKHGWKTDAIVVSEATVTGDAYAPIVAKGRKGLKPSNSLETLSAKYGVTAKSVVPQNMKAIVMELDGKAGKEYWLGFHNFYVITRYNHSHMYAMAGYQLSQLIKD